MVDPPARLVVVARLPAAGKTTRARELARRYSAVRLNADEWMADLAVDLFNEPFRERLEQRLIAIGREILLRGGAVVIDFGSWSRAERDQLLAMGREVGVRVEIEVFDLSLGHLWRRLERRNAEPGQTVIDRATLESYVAHWDRPGDAELARYDAFVVVDDAGEAHDKVDPAVATRPTKGE